MVGVALQLKQDQVRHPVVAVPRVVWLAGFVTAVFVPQALNAVMLDIVGGSQLKGPPKTNTATIDQPCIQMSVP